MRSRKLGRLAGSPGAIPGESQPLLCGLSPECSRMGPAKGESQRED
jgi:hypothetical protein